MLNNDSLTDLEKMTELIFRNPQLNPEFVKKSELLELMYEQNPSSFIQLFEFLITTNVETCQFWIMQLLIKITNNYFNLIDEDKIKFRNALLYLFDNCIEKLTNQQYIHSKFCVLYITWVKFDYPENWVEAFSGIIKCTNSTTDEKHKFLKLSKLN